jgi:predicted ATP-grasp superfamily ATP-dependent carboligase
LNRVLIAGLSTRAAAASAVAAGFAVTAVDAFGDLDVDPSVRAVSLPRNLGIAFSADGAAGAAAAFVADAVVYLANFENEPDAVRALADGRALWGNPPDVLRRVRDPRLLMTAFREHGIRAPAIRLNANAPNDPNGPNDPNDPRKWLVKPFASGGGRGVRSWKGSRVPADCYLQEHVQGVAASVVFVSAAGVAVPIGVSRQLIGDAAFGADRYRYCGNILAPAGDTVFEDDETLEDRACAIASAVTASFGLVGVNGVDFVAAAGEAHPVEVNPRWSGSMELAERAYGRSVFGMHADACARGALPAFDLRRARRSVRAVGKAILFAREPVTMGDTRPWLADATVRDVPQPGERIAAGRPICTIFAEAADDSGCYCALVRRAERLYSSLAGAVRLE